MQTRHRSAIGTLLAALATLSPVHAGTLSGTATLRQPGALPPDAVFEAVLIDVAIADAPARELGRVRLQAAGQPPFRFSISYRDGDLTAAGRYAVRATVRQRERLLFTTDTFTPVLSDGPRQPLTLVLVAVDVGLPGPNGTSRWPVDLAPDGSVQLRQTVQNRPAPNRFNAR